LSFSGERPDEIERWARFPSGHGRGCDREHTTSRCAVAAVALHETRDEWGGNGAQAGEAQRNEYSVRVISGALVYVTFSCARLMLLGVRVASG
jgi:hypothetical protein